MIAQQMQPGLEKVFKDFGKVVEKPLPRPPTPPESSKRSSRRGSSASSDGSLHSVHTNGYAKLPVAAEAVEEDEENILRQALETAVTSAIDLFQLVDKAQLSLLGSTTDLTGPTVERLIERYVTEQVHDNMLFPRVCALHRFDDLALESKIKQMENVDISQVGIPLDGGIKAKRQLTARLERGIEQFRKISVAGSPQEMLEILLSTAQTITKPDDGPVPGAYVTNGSSTEKPSAILTINADTLVSMLLIVVIRSHNRHLQARLAYMQHFIFIDDVEAGELGYALSTLEAVLSYLATDSAGLRKASRRNKHLWQAIKTGKLKEVQELLEPEKYFTDNDGVVQEPESIETLDLLTGDDIAIDDSSHMSVPNGLTNGQSRGDQSPSRHSESSTLLETSSEASSLNHVFPFQTQELPVPDKKEDERPLLKVAKRVSMDARSLSGSISGSEFSFRSRTTTIDSRGSGIEGDTSIDKLTNTQGSNGESVLMMAVETSQMAVLKYLLSLEEYFPLSFVLEDMNNEGTTILSAAVQLGNMELVETILDFVLRSDDDHTIISYFSKQDSRGRTVAHWLFNTPSLITRIGPMLPWRLKDKNGQTPLFALFRSYDHSDYRKMVSSALLCAKNAQKDGQSLHLDDHVDGKGNTLLHIVNDPQLAVRILLDCDSDVNAANDKRFTALMVASKYGRVDMVRALFGDPRVDWYAKELRGLTAVELAKDDEVRNRIDDLILFSNTPAEDGRVTAVVRSFFVEDATIRLVIKSGAPSSNSTITVTTCRRSLVDFENLAKWLSVENPASWIPSVANMRSPFQIPSKPSRAVLRDIQVRLDSFLKILLSHSTFSTHEMLWEFFLVPDIQPEMMAERSKTKALAREDRVRDEYEPVEDVRDVEAFVAHAKEMVGGVNHSTKSVVRRVNKLRVAITGEFTRGILS
jgi:ankyrin repeat protein